MSDGEACAVCGRSILAGERTHTYTRPKAGPQLVCELCRRRAERRGWAYAPPPTAEDREPPLEPPLPQAALEDTDPEPPAEDVRLTVPGDPVGESTDEIELGPAEGGDLADPAAPGATVGRRLEPEVAESPQMRLERAVARFNASEASRTVGGLMRTLGQPWVSIGAAAGSPSEVRITVAWELGWYQWAVDLQADPGEIRQLDKGREIAELDGPARQWNATAAPGGVLELGAPTAGAASGDRLA